MALITRIREKGGVFILVAMILAILGFILMDLVTASDRSGGSLFSNTSNVVGEVAGNELTLQEMEARRSIYPNNEDMNGTNQTVWNEFVDESILRREADALGMSISKDELRDLEFDPTKMSPVMMGLLQSGQIAQQDWQLLGNAIKTGQPLETLFQNAPADLVANFIGRWNQYERMIIKERLQAKLTNFVSKGIYTPSWMADMGYEELSNPADFELVRVPFDKVTDAEAQLTDADYETYLNENTKRLEAEEETRKVSLVVFSVAPSAEDSMEINKRVGEVVTQWGKAVNDTAFLTMNGSTYPRNFAKKDEIQNPGLKELAFSVAEGTILAPYIDGKSYAITKILSRKTAPDSVKARHILVPTLQSADSLKALIESGRMAWDSVNLKHSTDSVARLDGGSLGTFAQGRMVGEFNDLVFYKAQVGKYYTLKTQFGAHIIQVQGTSGKIEPRVKYATVVVPIMTGDKTQKTAEDLALGFATQNRSATAFEENAKKNSYQIMASNALKLNDFMVSPVGGGSAGRELVKWAFKSDTRKGDVSPKAYGFKEQNDLYISRYVVATLKSIQPKGLPSVADVKNEEGITTAVRNKKKAKLLAEKLSTPSDLVTVAQQYGSKVDTAKSVTFNATFIPNVGSEPKVIANAFTLPIGQVSKAILGEQGVFVMKVTNRTTQASIADKTILKTQLAGNLRNALRGRLVPLLRKNTKIKDMRSAHF